MRTRKITSQEADEFVCPSGVASSLRGILSEHDTGFAFIVDEDSSQVACAITPRTWDSEFFETGFATIRFLFEPAGFRRDLAVECAKLALEEAFADRLECIIARLPPSSSGLSVLEELGFEIWDRGVTLILQVGAIPESPRRLKETVREAEEEDLWQLVLLASNLFSQGHFHTDPRIGRDLADSMYGIWIRNLFYDDHCYVAVLEAEREIVGFSTIRMCEEDQDYVIDLIGVNEKHRKTGHASSLMREVLVHVEKGARVRVSTQASNEDALDLYRRFGFREVDRYVTLHLWRK